MTVTELAGSLKARRFDELEVQLRALLHQSESDLRHIWRLVASSGAGELVVARKDSTLNTPRSVASHPRCLERLDFAKAR